jgi:hypothetical protein
MTHDETYDYTHLKAQALADYREELDRLFPTTDPSDYRDELKLFYMATVMAIGTVILGIVAVVVALTN